MIYCLGTSHVTVFSGNITRSQGFPNIHGDSLPEFRTAAVDSFLAYNLRYKDHAVHTRIEQILKQIPEKSNLMFMFGEVDCRAHIPKQFYKKERTMEEIAWDCVGGYVAGITEFVDRGYSVLLWGPHAIRKMKKLHWHAEGPWEDIHEAARLFNKYSRVRCEGTPIKFATLYDRMVEDELYLDTYWYQDNNHLSLKCLPVIYKVMREAGFPL